MSNLSQPVFSIIDPELKDIRGHYFQYDKSIANEIGKRGWRPIIFAAQNVDKALNINAQIFPVFSQSIWSTNPHPMWGNGVLHLPAMLIFFFQLLHTRRLAKIDNRSILFFPTLLGIHILPIALAMLVFKTRAILVLRFQLEFYQSSIWAKIGFYLLRGTVANGHASLVSDSHILAEELSSATLMPVEVIPIPHVLANSTEQPFKQPAKSRDALLRFVYLGDARREKGIIDLLQAIKLMSPSERIEFVLQVNDPDSRAVRRAINQFRVANYPNVVLIERALPEQKYRDLIKSADLVLLPYISEFYRARTSGPFAEAIAFGNPVIVTEETWMAYFAHSLDTGITCPDKNPAALAKTMMQALSDIEKLKLKAKNAQSKWTDYHNPRRCLDAILDSDFSPPSFMMGHDESTRIS